MTDKSLNRDLEQLIMDYHEDSNGMLSVLTGYINEIRSKDSDLLARSDEYRSKLLAVHSGLKRYDEAVTAMRVSQKQYFKTRTQSSLADCKRIEGFVDSLGNNLAIEFKLRPDVTGDQKKLEL